MNAGLVQKRSRSAQRGPGPRTLASLIAKGNPGPLGAADQPANPKDVTKESQSIRLARLLLARHA